MFRYILTSVFLLVAEPGAYTEEIQRIVGLQLLVEAEHFRRISQLKAGVSWDI